MSGDDYKVFGEYPPLAGVTCEHGYDYQHVLYTAGKVSGHCSPTTGPVYYRDQEQSLCEGYGATNAIVEAIEDE